MKKTIGIIGCGAIGSAIAWYAAEKLQNNIEKIYLCDTDSEKLKELAEKIECALAAENMEALIDASDLVIEAVSPKIVPDIIKAALEQRKDVMVMSVGGLLSDLGLLEKAREKGTRILLPSGAIAGIDGLKAAKIGGLESVTITTRKSPKSIKGAPYLEENSIDVDAISGEEVVFEGTALEAIKGFPKNVNVSAILSIAGIGPEKTRVKIVVSPEYTKNTHEIEMVGAAGTIFTRAENVPSPQNPKTSYLAALAAMASLDGYFDTVRVGT